MDQCSVVKYAIISCCVILSHAIPHTQWIQVYSPGGTFTPLQISEVRVFLCGDLSLTNVALNKSSRAVTLPWTSRDTSLPNRVVDGYVSCNDSNQFSLGSDGGNPFWWEVDLGQEYDVCVVEVMQWGVANARDLKLFSSTWSSVYNQAFDSGDATLYGGHVFTFSPTVKTKKSGGCASASACNCLSHGTVLPLISTFPFCGCSCTSGYSGAVCEQQASQCSFADCSNNAGNVSGTKPNCSCSCLHGYYGSNCSLQRTRTAPPTSRSTSMSFSAVLSATHSSSGSEVGCSISSLSSSSSASISSTRLRPSLTASSQWSHSASEGITSRSTSPALLLTCSSSPAISSSMATTVTHSSMSTSPSFGSTTLTIMRITDSVGDISLSASAATFTPSIRVADTSNTANSTYSSTDKSVIAAGQALQTSAVGAEVLFVSTTTSTSDVALFVIASAVRCGPFVGGSASVAAMAQAMIPFAVYVDSDGSTPGSVLASASRIGVCTFALILLLHTILVVCLWFALARSQSSGGRASPSLTSLLEFSGQRQLRYPSLTFTVGDFLMPAVIFSSVGSFVLAASSAGDIPLEWAVAGLLLTCCYAAVREASCRLYLFDKLSTVSFEADRGGTTSSKPHALDCLFPVPPPPLLAMALPPHTWRPIPLKRSMGSLFSKHARRGSVFALGIVCSLMFYVSMISALASVFALWFGSLTCVYLTAILAALYAVLAGFVMLYKPFRFPTDQPLTTASLLVCSALLVTKVADGLVTSTITPTVAASLQWIQIFVMMLKLVVGLYLASYEKTVEDRILKQPAEENLATPSFGGTCDDVKPAKGINIEQDASTDDVELRPIFRRSPSHPDPNEQASSGDALSLLLLDDDDARGEHSFRPSSNSAVPSANTGEGDDPTLWFLLDKAKAQQQQESGIQGPMGIRSIIAATATASDPLPPMLAADEPANDLGQYLQGIENENRFKRACGANVSVPSTRTSPTSIEDPEEGAQLELSLNRSLRRKRSVTFLL